MKENYFLNATATIFFIFAIMAVINSFFLESPFQIFWYCYIGLIVLAMSIYRRDGYFLGAQICILTIPILFWNLDFFYRIITGEVLFGFTSYMFNGRLAFSQFASLQHVIVFPLAILSFYLIKSRRFDFWKLAFFEVFVIYIATWLFSPAELNINCAFKSCEGVNIGVFSQIPYFIVWLGAFFIMISLVNLFLYLFKSKTI